ncbi:hypothetical protein ACFXHA_30805 [Nocardia sp. NPDC059240]|uniref:hypothetical protein n=1 Tax=Nocardia sp. NPDC059240 TaxID=3346786 RepID=UPI0036C6FFFF
MTATFPVAAPVSADLEPHARNGIRPLVAAAGLTFLTAWIVGLSVWPTNLSVCATGTQILDALAGHTGVATVQFVTSQGIAGLALAVVLTALARPARMTGAAAVAVSLTQCALGVHLAGWIAPEGHAGTAATVYGLIDRLDGVKMLLLAATAVLASIPLLRNRTRPRFLPYLGLLLAAAIAVSGIGYLLLSTALAPAAYVSGVLLLIWVPAVALTARR